MAKRGHRHPAPRPPSGGRRAPPGAVRAVVVALAVLVAAGLPGPGISGDRATIVAPDATGAPSPRHALLLDQVRRQPRDGRAWALLAYDAMDADRHAEAAQAFERAIAASPRIAADPGVLCDYADALGMTQGGSLKGRPTEWIDRALALRPDHPKALEMSGSAAWERRDFALAARQWRRLLGRLDAGSDPARALARAIERAERLASTAPR